MVATSEKQGSSNELIAQSAGAIEYTDPHNECPGYDTKPLCPGYDTKPSVLEL